MEKLLASTKYEHSYLHRNFDGSTHLLFYNLEGDILEWLVNIGFQDTTVDIEPVMREKYPEEYASMLEIIKLQLPTEDDHLDAKADEQIDMDRDDSIQEGA